MARPPSVGATAIGIRLRMDWTVNPTARRSLGSASPTTANSVGLAMLDHAITKTRPRSEEHTSELQSLAYLVCRLLLEKKNKNELLHLNLNLKYPFEIFIYHSLI